MELIDLGRLTGLVGGELVSGDPGSLIGPDVVTDSRAVTAGCLFVAFEGERVDGHEYVAQATASGAAAALVARRVDADLPQVVVDDTTLALGALARGVVAAAKRAGLVVVGITGSSGKTSTKDLVAQVLETSGPPWRRSARSTTRSVRP